MRLGGGIAVAIQHRGILEGDAGAGRRRNKDVGRNGVVIEAAHSILAAGVETVERRDDLSSVAGGERAQGAYSDYVAVMVGAMEILELEAVGHRVDVAQ